MDDFEAWRIAQPIMAYGRFIVREQRAKTEQSLIAPLRPLATGGMSYA
jgi:hypothetical protein